MQLKYDLVYHAVTSKKPFKKMFHSNNNALLDDFVVSDYVTTENIPVITLDDVEVKTDPSLFFKDYQFLTELEIDEILEYADTEFISAYHNERIYPHDFSIHFFYTFIVIDIFPDTINTEFLVISPLEDKGGISQREITMTSMFLAISGDLTAKVALFIEIDRLLEYLRSGRGRKKKFGIF